MPSFKNLVRSQPDEEVFEILSNPFLYNKEHFKAALTEAQKRDLLTSKESKEVEMGNTAIIKYKLGELKEKDKNALRTQKIRKVKVWTGRSLMIKGSLLTAGGLTMLLWLNYRYQYRSDYVLFFPYFRYVVTYGMITVGIILLLTGLYKNIFRK